MATSTENTLETTITVLKSKRPQALTEEQKLDIDVEAKDAKEQLSNLGQKLKGYYQQRVAELAIQPKQWGSSIMIGIISRRFM